MILKPCLASCTGHHIISVQMQVWAACPEQDLHFVPEAGHVSAMLWRGLAGSKNRCTRHQELVKLPVQHSLGDACLKACAGVG